MVWVSCVAHGGKGENGAGQNRDVANGKRVFGQLRALLGFSKNDPLAIAHWRVVSFQRVHAGALKLRLMAPDGGRRLEVRLTRRAQDRAAFCRTASFNVVYVTGVAERSQTPQAIERVMTALCRRLRRNDRGTVTLGRYVGPTRRPPSARRTVTATLGKDRGVWAMALLLCVLLVFLLRWPTGRRSMIWGATLFERHPWPFVVGLFLILAPLYLYRLDLAFDADYMTQRVFFASLDPLRILAHRYPDSRHPQLYYLVLHVFLRFGHSEWLARLPAVLCGLGAVVGLFVWARQRVGGAGGLLAAALLGGTVAFVRHCRDVSDLSLFVLLALLSCHAFTQALRRPSRRRVGFYAVVTVALFYAYYLALFIGAAQVFVAALHARRARYRRLWVAFGVIGLAVAPALWDLAHTLWADLQTRQVAALFPTHVWGEKSSSEVLWAALALYFPRFGLGLAAAVFPVLGVVRWIRARPRDPMLHLVLAVVVPAIGAVGLGVVFWRLNAYYLLFTVPFVFLLTAGGVVGIGKPPRQPLAGRKKMAFASDLGRGDTNAFFAQGLRPGGAGKHASWKGAVAGAFGVMAAWVLVYTYGGALVWALPGLHGGWQQRHFARLGRYLKSRSRRPAQMAVAGGRLGEGWAPEAGDPPIVVMDPDCLHTIILYYAFNDPLPKYRSCRPRRVAGSKVPTVVCQGRFGRLITLTPMAAMRKGWRRAALRRLEAVRKAAYAQGNGVWFIYTTRFENRLLLRRVRQVCVQKGRWPPLSLYWCPPAGQGAPGGQRRDRLRFSGG
jgi:4-amino-4-deoxy-L-arabinose transferase-like glycosyltransferase